MKKVIFILINIFAFVGLQAQTADIQSGCAPLEVNFTGPSQATYFWEFADGSFSDLANPSHIFDTPGTYNVELFTSNGGTKIGETEITVYQKPQFAISADVQTGCSPLQVQFTNESIVDPNVNITGYFWDFGDGTSSSQENPSHIYGQEGMFTVSLRIESDEEGCTETESFPNFIMVSGNVNAGFSVDQSIVCEAPATITITNNTVDGAGYTYNWDFGNGSTSTDYNPSPQIYNEDGDYTIELVVDNGDGCIVTLTRIIQVGKPKIILDVQDTFCINVNTQIINNSTANEFEWSFGAGAFPQTTNLRNPIVRYSTPGAKVVTFSAIASPTCKSDTFFTIFVEDPSAAFTIDPMVSCLEPATYTFNHPTAGYAEYLYYVRELDDLFLGTDEEEYTYEAPTRDSFYINRSDTFNVILNITTQAGCKAEDSTYFIHRAPQAHFIPNVSRGCAPLTVNFTEDSRSNEAITSWSWIFGDGDIVNTSTSEDMIHTYTEPGEYYVKIAIENDAGCQDTSAGIFIYVGEPVTADFTVDKTEICLYDNVDFTAINLDPKIDAYHFNTDDGRISHCYTGTTANHEFIHTPGVFPVTLELEYNGCFSTIDNGTEITVNGSKSRIKYMTNCEEPLTVMLQDSSVNATTSIWQMNGDTISMDTIPGDSFNYTFDSTGNYVVTLITTDDSPCATDTSTVELMIREITAEFELPEYLCEGQLYTLDASMSQDVDESCSEGYTWMGVALRPRTLDTASVDAAWEQGLVIVSLITEDVNGCKDTLQKEAQSLRIEADFTPDRSIICYPSEVSFTDLSVADTTITSWDWDFGSNQQNPTDLFADGPDGFVSVQLAIMDEIGCRDTIIKSIEVYEPTSEVDFDPSNIVCLGETINFTATDYTEQGSFLNYLWTFGSEGTSMEQNPSFQVNTPGITTLSLIITEDNTGCNNEYLINVQGIEIPEAEIGLDKTEYCTSDNIVEFINNSTIDGPGGYFWNFGNGLTTSTGTNPDGSGSNTAATFEEGSYDITLTASSIYGCSDSDTKTINVSEPKGTFTTSEVDFCADDDIIFTMIDTNDVASYTWDFGDGTTVMDENPVTHNFGFYPPGGMYDVKLKLVNSNGCKTSVSVPVMAFNIDIDITPEMACAGEVLFDANAVVDGLTYAWSFENGVTSNDAAPTVDVPADSMFAVELTIVEPINQCSATFFDTILVIASPNVLWELGCNEAEDSIFLDIQNYSPALDYTIIPDITDNGFIEESRTHLDIEDGANYTFTITNEAGCIVEIPVVIEPNIELSVPNLFSPNNDGTNDFFDLIVKEKFRPFINDPLVFKVYNRWGNLLYDNETPQVGWDGKLSNGEFAPSEVYTYVIKVPMGDGGEGELKEFKGTVTLIK